MRRLIVVLMVLALTACASVPSPVASGDRFWRLNGKLSIQTRDQTRIVSIDWRQQGDASDIRLTGPLGAGLVQITTQEDELVIEANGESAIYDYGQAVEVEGEALRLPWKQLAYWVRGQKGPGMGPINGQYVEGEWLIRILDSGVSGPVLVQLQHPVVRLRLKVRAWQPDL